MIHNSILILVVILFIIIIIGGAYIVTLINSKEETKYQNLKYEGLVSARGLCYAILICLMLVVMIPPIFNVTLSYADVVISGLLSLSSILVGMMAGAAGIKNTQEPKKENI